MRPGLAAAVLRPAGFALALLAAGNVVAAPADCGRAAAVGVCVRVVDTAPSGLLDAVRQVFVDNACTPVDSAAVGIRARTTEAGLFAIQRRLAWDGINFLWIGDSGAAGCDVELVALSPSSAAAPIEVAAPQPARPPAMPGSRLPDLLLRYESREEALPDLLLLMDRFDYLDAEDRATALNAMQTFYFDWRLLQARQFIERVALGDKRYGVEPEVSALAMRLLTAMEGD